jgi:hypothetical protein
LEIESTEGRRNISLKIYDTSALTHRAETQTCNRAEVCSSQDEICNKCGAEVREDSKKGGKIER